jgi:hypothetical protein
MTRARTCALVLASAAVLGCAGPPWFMGSPLDGRPSIPRGRKNLSFKALRAEAATARTKGQPVLELPPLIALDDLDRLETSSRARLVTLLERRAADFNRLGRAIPESRDLERLALLAPARGAGLLGERALAARGAGDAWLAVGALQEARAAYVTALGLGAADMGFRVRALWGHPPPETTTLAELRAAIAALPLRAVPPFAQVYVTDGGSDRATLTRGLAAARQEQREALAVRLSDALLAPVVGIAADGVDAGARSDARSDASSTAPSDDAIRDGGAPADGDAAPAAPPLPASLDAWMLAGVTVEGRLLPLVVTHPEILDDLPRALGWVDILLGEDPTSPEILELAAMVFGRAQRFGGTERMLMELTYATPDRAVGLARGAAVWARLGRVREACAQRLRAARWRDDPEDPEWRAAISCARRDPGVADWRQIRTYVLTRARPDRRAALAAALDAP